MVPKMTRERAVNLLLRIEVNLYMFIYRHKVSTSLVLFFTQSEPSATASAALLETYVASSILPIPLLLYGGILLPSICKINYVKMQHNYVYMRFIYASKQQNYVDATNLCRM